MRARPVIGLTDADVFPPEIAAAMRDQERRIMETGATEVLEETIPDRHHGEPRVFLTTKTPLRDPAGAIVGIIGVARDITERKAGRRRCAAPRRRRSAPTWRSPSSWRRPATTCVSPFSP